MIRTLYNSIPTETYIRIYIKGNRRPIFC